MSYSAPLRFGFLAFLLDLILLPIAAQSVTPELPRTFLSTNYDAAISQTCNVTVESGNVQVAIDNANQNSNYVICLRAGGTFSPFILKNKTGNGWITIRTTTSDQQLPAPGNRVAPANASLLAKILSPNTESAVSTQASAHNYRLIGLEVTSTYASTQYTVYNLINLGNNEQENTVELTPRDIIIDRSYIHGTATGNYRRGVTFNGRRLAVIDSYISDIHEVGADSQAVGAWNGPGPFKISNNFLAGSGENIMFGGSMPSIPNLVASDIEIRGNHIFKPLSWKLGDPTYTNIPWVVKNLFELKSARRVLIEGNVFENLWYSSQRGTAVVLTVRVTQGGPDAVVEDLTFTYNVFKRITESVNSNGFDDYDAQHRGKTQRVLFRNNLFDRTAWNETCCTYQLIVQNRSNEIEFDHNTFIDENKVGVVLSTEGELNTKISFTNNIFPMYRYGISPTWGPSTCSNCQLNKNVFVDHGDASVAQMEAGLPGNFFPGPWTEVGMINKAAGQYGLAVTSAYKNRGSDGKDPGADIVQLNAITANVVSGVTTNVKPDAPSTFKLQ